MKKTILLIAFYFFFLFNAFSQTSLEMFAGVGNPTGNGPIQSTTITLQNNTNNPNGNTVAATANPLTVTYTLGNHAYPYNNNISGSNFISNIGASNSGGTSIFPLINSFASPSNSFFTAGSIVGQGIDVSVNRGVNILVFSRPLQTNGVPVFSRVRVSDLTITFSRPVDNPILHIGGTGATVTGNTISTEFTVLGGYTLTRLSGNSATGFVVPPAPNNNQINNQSSPFAPTGVGSGSGSVRVNGVDITTLTIQIYLDADTVTTWGDAANNADGFTLSVSLAQNDVNAVNDVFLAGTAGTAFTTASVLGNDTVNGAQATTSNVVVSGVSVPSGFTLNANGSITKAAATPGGVYDLTYQICDVSESGNCKTATVRLTVIPDSDGDGIGDDVDLDDDNDGILDINEGFCNSESIYTLDLTLSVASGNSGFTGNGGTFNLVYTLTSGPPVSGLGSTFNVPFTYSDFNNNASDVDHRWQLIISQGNFISIVPNTDTFYTGLPANNRNENEDVSGSSNNFSDGRFRYLLNTSRIDQLGSFMTTFGHLPLPTGTLSTYNTQTNLWVFSFNNNEFIVSTPTLWTSGFYARMLDQETLSTQNSNTAPLSTNYGVTHKWIYTAFDAPGGSNANSEGTRGLINIFRNTITYCNHLDTDGDGTPDYLDVDADNDGCFDAIEGSDNVQLAQLNPNGSINSTVDAQGVPVLVNSGGVADVTADQGQGGGDAYDGLKAIQCLDSDGDGIADVVDLDDDNDGILDIVEAECETLNNETYASTTTNSLPQSTSSLNVLTTSNALAPYTVNSAQTVQYGNGSGKVVGRINFASGKTLTINPNAPSSILKIRRNTANVVPSNEILWLESSGSSLSNASRILLNKPNSYEDILSKGFFNVGLDNVFNNQLTVSTPNASNIERFDVIFSNGYKVINPDNDYLLVTERGLNDDIVIAAITAVNSSGLPTAFGPVQTIFFENLVNIAPNMNTTIFRKEPTDANFRPHQYLQQSIGLGYINLQTLGISSGQTIYGYAILPSDYNTANILDWNTYPTNTGSTASNAAGASDFGFVGGVFSSCDFLVDIDNDGIPNYLDLDSDNDGCVDAYEGDENVTFAQLVTAGGTVEAGIGSSADNLNLCANGTCVNELGVPTIVNNGGTADSCGDLGQGIGSAYDATNNICFCTNAGDFSQEGEQSITGISDLQGFANGWPYNVPNGFIVMQSRNSGFVITRVNSSDDILEPIEGMIIYDLTDACIELYNGTFWSCLEKSCNYIYVQVPEICGNTAPEQ